MNRQKIPLAYPYWSRFFVLLAFWGSLANRSLAQVTELQTPSATYTRAGFTVVYVKDQNNPYAGQGEAGYNSWKLPPKYDENPVKSRVLPVQGVPSLGNTASVQDLLANNQVQQQIVGAIFNEKDGRYNYERLFERARYMMNDNAVLRLKQSAIGIESNAKTDAWIMPLIANTYVGLVSLGKVQPWQEVYDDIDNQNRERARRDRRYVFQPVRRTKRGYRTEVFTAVYQLELKDSVLYHFFDNYWADANTPKDKAEKFIAARKNLKLPMKLVAARRNPDPVSGIYPYSYDEAPSPAVAVEMACAGMLDAAVAQSEDLKTRTVIYDVWPIRAKIGTKEGVRTDQLFNIYEREQLADGTTASVWKGAVRASVRVSDNAQNTDGESQPTLFYQVAGKKLEQGMAIVEHPTLGLSGYLGWQHGNRGSFTLRVEAMARGFGAKEQRFWNNSRIYLEGGIAIPTFNSAVNKLNIISDSVVGPVARRNEVTTGANLYHITLGASKYFNFWHNVQTGPHLGIRGDFAVFNNTDLDKVLRRMDGDAYGFAGITVDVGWRAMVHVYQGFRLAGGVAFRPQAYGSRSFFSRNISSTISEQERNTLGLNDPSLSTVYGGAGTSNPFAISFQPWSWDLGMHFEF